MKLDAVHVRGYRSAQDVRLTDVGSFNVLIGKNNSGKSTVLFAIQAFFRCIAGGSLVKTNPPLGRQIDFSNKIAIDEPIRISLIFSLQLAERDELIRDIATEAPQLKNATDGLDPALKLEITVAVSRPPRRWSNVESMHLIGDAQDRRTLLKVSPQAAQEIVAKFQTSQTSKDLSKEVKRMLDSFDADDFVRMTRDNIEARTMASYYLRRYDPTPVAARLFETALRSSANLTEFQSKLSTARDQYLAEAQQAAQTPLKNTVETFSGNQDAVPAYVTSLLSRLTNMNVLYLTEERAPVGKPEAERLLSFKVKRGGQKPCETSRRRLTGSWVCRSTLSKAPPLVKRAPNWT